MRKKWVLLLGLVVSQQACAFSWFQPGRLFSLLVGWWAVQPTVGAQTQVVQKDLPQIKSSRCPAVVAWLARECEKESFDSRYIISLSKLGDMEYAGSHVIMHRAVEDELNARCAGMYQCSNHVQVCFRVPRARMPEKSMTNLFKVIGGLFSCAFAKLIQDHHEGLQEDRYERLQRLVVYHQQLQDGSLVLDRYQELYQRERNVIDRRRLDALGRFLVYCFAMAGCHYCFE